MIFEDVFAKSPLLHEKPISYHPSHESITAFVGGSTMHDIQPDPIFISAKDVAKRTGLSVQTLANDRHKMRGFPYVKRGRRVLYYWPDIFAQLQSSKIEHSK